MTAIVLGAPMGGWVVPLGEVPDAVFAGAMMGDGVAIDPLDAIVRAPCDATVDSVAPTGHSVTLTLNGGAALLIHVGIDTVALRGEGFRALVAGGERVTAGAPLIELDLDHIAGGAPSLVTPIVVASEGFVVEPLAIHRRVMAGDPILSIRASVSASARSPDIGDEAVRRQLVVPLATGIHARPAARIGAALKPFTADVCVEASRGDADARSTLALMKLAIGHGDAITLVGRGADAAAAVDAVATLIEDGMGEAHAVAPVPFPLVTGAGLRGTRAAPGLAIGPAFRFVPAEIAVPHDGTGVTTERHILGDALATVAAALDADVTDIAAAHRAMLDDPALVAGAHDRIAAGRSAGQAWREAVREQAAALTATGDPRMAERTADLLDLEMRVIARITGTQPTAPPPPAGAILIADDLLPSQFLALAPGGVAGIVTARGGPTSHVAILAAAAGVPMLVACGEAVLAASDGAPVVLDADAALIDLAPDDTRLADAAARVTAAAARGATARAAAQDACRTADGVRIEVFANLGSIADAHAAVAAGAEGCGLLRTEFLFLDRDAAPTEDEQRAAYAAVAEALAGRPLIVRTLDIGGDKPVAYLPFAREDNPALGERGVRLGLARPELLGVQLRAILRGVPMEQCRIMLPMIVDRGEFLTVRGLLDEAARAVGCAVPPLGVMIETPAAALLASDIARDAAFLSLGTNDLTQYALAADRGNPAMAARIDALHPAVLHLIARAGKGAAAHGRWLGVCGAVASDPAAAALLIGLGVTEFSVTPAAVPTVKAAIRTLTIERCRALADEALTLGSAAEVRALVGRP